MPCYSGTPVLRRRRGHKAKEITRLVKFWTRFGVDFQELVDQLVIISVLLDIKDQNKYFLTMSMAEENKNLKDRIVKLESTVVRKQQSIERINYDMAIMRDQMDNNKAQKTISYLNDRNERLTDRISQLKRAVEYSSFSGLYDEVVKVNEKLEKQIADLIAVDDDKLKLVKEECEAKLRDLEKINEELNQKISELIKEDATEEGKLLNSENLELERKLSAFEKNLLKEKETFAKQIFQKYNDSSKKSDEEKKRLELQCLKISNQISYFEKLVICEREKFEKEKTEFKTKSVELSCKISELEKTLEMERKEFEKKRSIFEREKESFEKKKVGVKGEKPVEKTKIVEKDFAK